MGLDPERLFKNFDLTGRRLVIAVSGGSDSLALLLLLADHVRADALLAVTVDHGLRPAAAAEARAVADLCRDLGIRHRTMTWEGAKPASGIIAAAREARYALLAQAARAFGSDMVLVAHTMDDQAETVAMRAARGEGAGLAGMADVTLFDGDVWIARPLLGVRRTELRGFLAARGVQWIDDPTNDDPAYERVRVRRALGDGDVEALCRRAEAEGKARSALSDASAGMLAGFATSPAPGLLRIDPLLAHVEAEYRDAAIHLLRALLATAGGSAHLPESRRAEAIFARLKGQPMRATLSRAALDARGSGIWIRRERRDVPALALGPDPFIWDGRWHVAGSQEPEDVEVAPLGADLAHSLADKDAAAPQSLVRAAFAVEPALFRDGAFVALLRDGARLPAGLTAHPVAAPFARFLPGFDLALAGALQRMTGAPPLPTPPWKQHIAPGP